MRLGVHGAARSWVAYVLSALSFRILGVCLYPHDVLSASRLAAVSSTLEGHYWGRVLPLGLAVVNECQPLAWHVRARRSPAL